MSKNQRAKTKFYQLANLLSDHGHCNGLPEAEVELLRLEAERTAREAKISLGVVDEELGIQPPRPYGANKLEQGACPILPKESTVNRGAESKE